MASTLHAYKTILSAPALLCDRVSTVPETAYPENNVCRKPLG